MFNPKVQIELVYWTLGGLVHKSQVINLYIFKHGLLQTIKTQISVHLTNLGVKLPLVLGSLSQSK